MRHMMSGEISNMQFKPGEQIRFTYLHPVEGMDEATGDRFKEVLVLHPNWMGKVHGIDLKRLTQAEREVLDDILNPTLREEVHAGKPHRIPLVNDILRRMNPVEEIKNPVSFYSRFVKVFLRNKDAYRTYDQHKMVNVTISQKTQVHGTVTNPKPLFHAVETKAPQPTIPTQQVAKPAVKQPSRLDRIKQLQAARDKDK